MIDKESLSKIIDEKIKQERLNLENLIKELESSDEYKHILNYIEKEMKDAAENNQWIREYNVVPYYSSYEYKLRIDLSKEFENLKFDPTFNNRHSKILRLIKRKLEKNGYNPEIKSEFKPNKFVLFINFTDHIEGERL